MAITILALEVNEIMDIQFDEKVIVLKNENL
jgi:hypothetical protein